MGNDKPLVSILIPAYKVPHFEVALVSALAQVYPNKEILVSDDCPTDEIRMICGKYPGIQYSRNPEPGGANNITRLAMLAKGFYLKYLFDDDLLQPLCVSRMVEAFEAGRNVMLAFSPRDIIDAENRITSRPRDLRVEGDLTLIDGRTLLRHCLGALRNLVGELTTGMFRRQDILSGDGLPAFFDFHGAAVPGLGDMCTYVKLLERGNAAYFAEPLSYFRVHPSSNTSNTGTAIFRAAIADWLVFARYACAQSDFSTADKQACLMNARKLMTKKLEQFPDLKNELAEIESLQRKLVGSGF